MKKFKKVFVSFSLGLLLSIVPITAFAASGITVTRLFAGGCPETIDYTIRENGYTLTIECRLTGESPDDGSGVSVCSYSCLEGV